MQAIKEKLSDLSAMRKVKNEAKEEEKEEKELAKARVDVAREVRLAREAEAAMDLHVNKAANKVVQQERKHSHHGGSTGSGSGRGLSDESYTQTDSYSAPNTTNPGAATDGLTTDQAYGGGGGAAEDVYAYGADRGSAGSAAISGTAGYTGNRTAGGTSPATNNLL